MKSCKSCFEELNVKAAMCNHCGSSQTITRFITPALSLILALVSILAVVGPQFFDLLNPDEPDISAVITSPAKMRYDEESDKWGMYIELAATNEGEIAAVYNGANFTVKFPDGSKSTGYLMLDRRKGNIVLKPKGFSVLKTFIGFDESIPYLEGQLVPNVNEYHNFKEMVIQLQFEAFNGEVYVTNFKRSNIAYEADTW